MNKPNRPVIPSVPRARPIPRPMICFTGNMILANCSLEGWLPGVRQSCRSEDIRVCN